MAAELNKPLPATVIAETLQDWHVRPQHARILANVMMHILRNSMDHGIESSEQRLAASKPEAGCIRIDCRHDEAGIVLEIADDGRGLALHHLKEKAIQTHMLSEQTASSDEQLAELIFRSGLSTAREVSMVSGRGVGMDAVRSSLAEIGASIHVEWQKESAVLAGYRPFLLSVCLPASLLRHQAPGIRTQVSKPGYQDWSAIVRSQSL